MAGTCGTRRGHAPRPPARTERQLPRGKGWGRRVQEVRSLALQMASEIHKPLRYAEVEVERTAAMAQAIVQRLTPTPIRHTQEDSIYDIAFGIGR